jgi:hypothetical protein
MTAEMFNRQCEDFLVGPLRRIGFLSHRQCLSYAKGQTVLALLRFQTKGSDLLQRANFLLCVRHTFLRTLEKESATNFLADPNE